MGNCFRKNQGDNKFSKQENEKDKKEEKDKKNLNMDLVFEEIKDIKDLQIKGAMLLNENYGKPREIYELLKNIASFNYGNIKMVRNKITKKIRAERVIKKELIEIKEEENLFLKELALLRTMDHPNIIKIYEFFREDKFYYLLSDYCEEGDLFKLIKRESNGFHEFTVSHIMRQLLGVVNYCHMAHNVVNRDLRPENILVDSIEKKFINGEEIPIFNIKVSDFKSARSFKNSKKLNKKVGNPYYIAPEVLKRKYNEKCDIWSCGIVMYILLTGKPPFSGNTDKEVIEKVENNEFEFFDKDLTGNTAECKSLLKELLKVDPVKRPSANDVLRHPFFRNNAVEYFLDKGYVFNCYKNFMKFNPEHKFQQAALAYMAHHLTDKEDVKEIQKIFEKFDTNKDGRLSHRELIDGFKSELGANMDNDKDLLKAVKKIDQDHSGFIDSQEFIRATINKRELLCDENLRIAFRLFDKDDSKSITPKELKEILGINSKYSDKVWNEIMNQIEHNGNYEVTIVEFKSMMEKLIN